MENLDVNAIIWGMFMSVALQAAVHLGNEYSENFRSHQESAPAIIETAIQCN